MSSPRKVLAPALWERFVDLCEQDSQAKHDCIKERLDQALGLTGEDRAQAVGIWRAMGAGHDPEKMKQGISGSGTLFKIFSQELLDRFLGLGGDDPTSAALESEHQR